MAITLMPSVADAGNNRALMNDLTLLNKLALLNNLDPMNNLDPINNSKPMKKRDPWVNVSSLINKTYRRTASRVR
ncbi:hypothetical protein [Yersinia pseudotuberculosis]|uniref:hypothetical protein n=1 Tax=Yersinia pseudotuberculosis TaxID=633 RepID=UPI001FB57594|nr:hypothetical protein [Yersinia pseudotuberculosis]